MIDTVLFDLDETLFDFLKAEEIAIKKTLEINGIEPTDALAKRYSEINLSLWKLLEKGEITRERLLIKRFEILYSEIGVKRSGVETQKIYEKLLGTGHYFMPYAEGTINILRKKYRLYAVSNGTWVVQSGRIKSSGLDKILDGIFVSEKVGHVKPQKEFFEVCFKEIGNIELEKTIIVGDSLTSDIKGGINAGIHTCLYNPMHKENKSDIIPEYEIDCLSKLPCLLESI